MKKILASLIVLMLMLSCCIIAAMPASAADGVNYDDWLIYDGSIIEYVGTDADVVVPTKDADGLPITKIESSAFAGTVTSANTTLESVVVPEGITEFGSCVFEFCRSLVEVSLPKSLEKSGYSTFRYCTSLTELTIPGNLKEVPGDFSTGAPITEYVISYGVEVFKPASVSCISSEIIFPKSVYEIDGQAMRYINSETGERLEVYITNDDCMLGKNTGNILIFEENWGDYGPILRLSRVPDQNWYNSTTKMHIYGLEDGKVKEYVSKYMSDGEQPWYYAVFHEMTEDELDEKNQFCKDNATKETSSDDKNNDDNDDDDKDSNNNDDDNDDKNGDSSSDKSISSLSGDNSDLIIIIAAIGGGFLLLIIVIVVVMALVMASKKKKKKKKKKAKAEAEAGPPVEEVPIEEVSTEEVSTEEVPAEETPIEEVPQEKGEEE